MSGVTLTSLCVRAVLWFGLVLLAVAIHNAAHPDANLGGSPGLLENDVGRRGCDCKHKNQQNRRDDRGNQLEVRLQRREGG